MGKRATSANAGKGATHRVSKSTASRVLTYAPPWAAWIIVLPLSAVAYVTWGRNPTAAPWMSMAAFALVAALVPFTWRVLRPRDEVLQWMGTVSAGLGGFWFIVGMLVGPLTRGVIDAWGFGGFGICVFWTIRRMVVNGAAEQHAEPQESPLVKALNGARVQTAKAIDGRVVGELEVNRGSQTVKDLQGARETIEAALPDGVRPGALRIAKHPTDAGRATYAIVPTDPLAGEIPWPGPSAPGASIADAPIPIGMYEDGTVASVYLCGDDSIGRALAHWLIMGMNGSGKSQAWVMAMADALTRYDFELRASDHIKATQTFGPLLRYMTKVAFSLKDAKALINEVRDEAAERFADFGKRGIKQWEKGCGYPLTIVWVEEAPDVVSDSAAFTKLVEQVRSAGFVVVVSMQLAKHDRIDTTARAQLAAAVCFGVRDAQDATYALPDTVLDAGAAPDNWGNRKPGYAYLVAPGVDEEMWPVPLRTFRARDPQIVAVLGEWATPVREIESPATSLVSSSLEGDVVDPDDTEDEDGMEPIPPTLEPDMQIDPDQPISPPSADANLAFGGGSNGPKLSTEQARAVVQQHLRTLAEQGQTHTQPANVCQMKPATTRSREWVRQELNRLCEQAGPGEVALERDVADMPGVYRIVAPSLAGV
ncbi:hypothetical protein ABZ388_06650 [Micromonospora parva]|uniref:hypothetical protein n=1 Tax=Micromonospora parva TaxID=1464048 RepID=UPI0033E659D0